MLLKVNSKDFAEPSELEIENDSSSESGDDTNDDDDNQHYSKFRPKLLRRTEDELEFEDEIEYGSDTILSERFKKYKYLPSFYKTEWNIYVRL
jgi:hypothetical protein